MKISVLERWCYRSWRPVGFQHTRGLTWTFLDTKCAVGVLGSGVVLQLERGGVVHKRLRALGHARPAVVEIGARLQRKHTSPVRSGRQADRHTPEEVSFSHNIRHQGVSFQWHFGWRSCPSALWTPNGRETGALIQSRDVNGEMLSHKLQVFASDTGWEDGGNWIGWVFVWITATILQLCRGWGRGDDSERLIKATLIGTPNQQLMTAFYRPVKRQTIHQPANNFRQKLTKRC